MDQVTTLQPIHVLWVPAMKPKFLQPLLHLASSRTRSLTDFIWTIKKKRPVHSGRFIYHINLTCLFSHASISIGAIQNIYFVIHCTFIVIIAFFLIGFIYLQLFNSSSVQIMHTFSHSYNRIVCTFSGSAILIISKFIAKIFKRSWIVFCKTR